MICQSMPSRKKSMKLRSLLVYILVTECNFGFRDKIEIGLENTKKAISRSNQCWDIPVNTHTPSVIDSGDPGQPDVHQICHSRNRLQSVSNQSAISLRLIESVSRLFRNTPRIPTESKCQNLSSRIRMNQYNSYGIPVGI